MKTLTRFLFVFLMVGLSLTRAQRLEVFPTGSNTGRIVPVTGPVTISITGVTGISLIDTNPATGIIKLGDFGLIGNSTRIVIDDPAATITIQGGAGINIIGTPTLNNGLIVNNQATFNGDIVANFKVVTKQTATNYTIGTTNPRELYGGVIYVTGAATITAPAVATGASFTVITIGAVAVSVDPNAADLIYLDGTALTDGDKITNLSKAGDIAVFTYYDATGWYATTNGWTNGH